MKRKTKQPPLVGVVMSSDSDWPTLHLYGKRELKPGRTRGHFTVIGDDPQEVFGAVMAARAAIGIQEAEKEMT